MNLKQWYLNSFKSKLVNYYKVVNCVKRYNFDKKFVLLRVHMKSFDLKLNVASATHSWFLYRSLMPSDVAGMLSVQFT